MPDERNRVPEIPGFTLYFVEWQRQDLTYGTGYVHVPDSRLNSRRSINEWIESTGTIPAGSVLTWVTRPICQVHLFSCGNSDHADVIELRVSTQDLGEPDLRSYAWDRNSPAAAERAIQMERLRYWENGLIPSGGRPLDSESELTVSRDITGAVTGRTTRRNRITYSSQCSDPDCFCNEDDRANWEPFQI